MDKHILVVDDNRAIRRLVTLTLEKVGYTVTNAANVDDAIILAKSQHLDLILMDIMMPKKTGYDGIRELQGNDKTKNIPIILITARAIIHNTSKEMMWRVYGYLTKPFSAKELIELVNNVMSMTHN